MKILHLIGLLFLFVGFGCAKAPPKRTISSDLVLSNNSEIILTLSNSGQFYHGNAGIIDLKVPFDLMLKEENLEAEAVIELTDGEVRTFLFPFYKVNDGHFQTILGIPYKAKRGTSELKILIKTNSDTQELRKNFEIIKFPYGKDKALTVDPNTVKPDPNTELIIEEQQKKLDEIYSHSTPVKLWNAPFKVPVKAPVVTSNYGNARVYNGELKSFHSGLDYRANENTDLFATNDGIVVLAEHLHFTGNTIIIDHGKGLFTVYGHMSKFDSKIIPQTPIKKGQLLGRAGRTGRVTGPHLHWALKIHSELINPTFLYSIK